MRIRLERGDRNAPQLQQTAPADNANGVAVNANLVLTFNEAVKAGTGNFAIHNAANGSVVQSIAVTDASKVSFSGSQVTINPGSDLSPGTAYYVTFASGVVRDLTGNAHGGISSSTAFNFSTSAPPAAPPLPTLVNMIPADNDSDVMPWSDIVLFFNKEVKPGLGNIEIHKSDGSLVTAISITDTFQVQFADHVVTLNPHADLVWSTGYYVTFASGVIRDLQNNPAAGVTSSTQFNFTTSPDNTDPGPLLVSATPSDNATNVNVGANIVLTFSEPIKLGNPDGTIRIYYADGTAAKLIYLDDPSQVTISGNTLTVNPTTDLLSQTAYYVTTFAGNILRLDGGAGFAGLTSPTSLNFVTGTSTDVTGPVLSTLPADNTVNVARSASLHLYFNEGVKAGSGNVEIYRASDDTLVEAMSITNAGRVTFYEDRVMLFPATTLDWNTQYYVKVAPGVIQDYVGNNFGGISSSTAFSFTTIGDPAVTPPILISSYGPSRIDGGIGLYFTEFVQAGDGTIEIRRSSDGGLVKSVDIHDAGQIRIFEAGVTLDPDINLDPHTQYYVLVSPGAIKDLAGNNYAGITSTTAFQFATGPLVPPPPPYVGGVFVEAVGGFFTDTTAPSLTAINPADNSSSVPIAANLILTFDEKVAAGAGDLEIRKLSDGSLFKSIALSDTTQVQFSDYVITVNPNVNLGLNTGYYVVLKPGAVQDWSGNAYAGFAGSAGFNFTTASSPDTTPPALTFSYGGFHLDETVVRGTGNIEFRRLLDGSLYDAVSVTDTTRVVINENLVSVTPNIPLLDSAAYYITLGAGVFKDLAGNALAATTSPYFTTADQNAPVLQGISPSDDSTNVPVNSNIVLTFSEAVQAGGQFIFVSVGSHAEFIIDPNDVSQITFFENTVIVNPNADLIPGTTYTLSVSYGSVRDINGNAYFGIDSGYYTFTTAPLGGGAPPAGSLTGTAASNTLVGSAGNDVITGLGQADTLTGGGGSDTFVYTARSDSTGRAYDTITDFNASGDLIDLWFQINGVDSAITGGSLSGTRRFDSDLASLVGSSKLAPHDAVLFTPSAGSLAGKTLLVIDVNGTAGYQGAADMVILLGTASSLGGLTAADFV